jgi:hypothetical protein
LLASSFSIVGLLWGLSAEKGGEKELKQRLSLPYILPLGLLPKSPFHVSAPFFNYLIIFNTTISQKSKTTKTHLFRSSLS